MRWSLCKIVENSRFYFYMTAHQADKENERGEGYGNKSSLLTDLELHFFGIAYDP